MNEHLAEIENNKQMLRGQCNAGITKTNKKGKFGELDVWYNPVGIANILSLPLLEKNGYKMQYQTDGEWEVYAPGKDRPITFKQDTGMCDGMPYIDLRDSKEDVNFIQTVRDNYEGFTKWDVLDAKLARRAQAMIGHPTDSTFKAMVSHKLLRNCTVKPLHVANADIMFGTDLSGVRGRTVRTKPERVETDEVEIPRDFYVLNRFVTLTADVMFVNGIAFLTTLSRKIRLTTVEHVPSRTAEQLSSSLTKIVQLYAKAGFTVRTTLMDMEFEKVAEKLNNMGVIKWRMGGCVIFVLLEPDV